MSPSSSALSPSLNSWNSSIVSSSSLQQQFNPFIPHQYNHLHKHPPKPYDDDVENDLQNNSGDDILDISSSSSSSSLSPINYFFNRAADSAMIPTSTEIPPLIGDRDADDYNYFLMSGGQSPAPGGAGFDSYSMMMLATSPPTPPLQDFLGGWANNTSIGGYSGPILLDNFWDVFDEQYLRHNLGWTITLVVAYILILIIGIIGNSMVILVVVFRPQMRNVTNMFIMNLAVADLFVIVFCVPATLLANVFTPWILGSFMCKGVAYVQGVSVCASAYSLAAISLDRCKAIYRPMERPKGLSKSQALSTICFIWIIALLMTIPWAVIFNVIVSEKDGLSYCIETWKNEKHGKIYFLVANLICCYSLPLVLISISNVVIWCHVSHRKVPQDSASIGTIKRMHRRTRHGVRKMLGIVTLAFLLSWLPLYVLVTRVKFSKNMSDTESNILEILLPLAQWLGSWNSSINPVLYAFLNSKFRESFKSLLPSWVPFVHRNNPRTVLMRGGNLGRGTVTNGTFTAGGTTTGGMQTYSNGYTTTARSSGRSSNNSRRFHHQHKNQHNHPTLLVSSFRGDLPATAATQPSVVATTTTTATITALAGGGGGGCGGNGTSTVVMTTTIASTSHFITTTNATITDL